MIDGFRVSHNAQIGERIGRQSSWKFGQGNPMFGIPGTAFEVLHIYLAERKLDYKLLEFFYMDGQ